jgi:hypothetical protein
MSQPWEMVRPHVSGKRFNRVDGPELTARAMVLFIQYYFDDGGRTPEVGDAKFQSGHVGIRKLGKMQQTTADHKQK